MPGELTLVDENGRMRITLTDAPGNKLFDAPR